MSDTFEERLRWHRAQPAPVKWPVGLVRLFVSTMIEYSRSTLP